MRVATLVLSLVLSFFLNELAFGSLEPARIAFELRSQLEPFQVSSCQHHKSDVGVYEWEVSCPEPGAQRDRRFEVHLALTRYPHAASGHPAYELLYGVTDWKDPSHPQSYSSTIWVHQHGDGDRIDLLEAGQGIENDNLELHLRIELQAKGKS